MTHKLLVVLALICGGCATTYSGSWLHSSTEYDSGGRCESVDDCKPPEIKHQSKGLFSSGQEVVAVAAADAIATNSRANLINARAHAEYMKNYGGPYGGAAYGAAGGGSPVPGVGLLNIERRDDTPVSRQYKINNLSGGYLRLAVNGAPLPGVVSPRDTVYVVSDHPTRAVVHWCVLEGPSGSVNGRGGVRLRMKRNKPRGYRVTRYHVRDATSCRF